MRASGAENAGLRLSTQSGRLLAVLSFAIGLLPHGAHAQGLSASDILKKVAARYSQASSFSVVAEKKVALDTDPGDKKYFDSAQDANVVYVGSHEDHEIQVTLTMASASKAKLVLKQGNKEVFVVRDSEDIWTFIPAQHAYTHGTEAGTTLRYVFENNDISGWELLGEYEMLVLTPFQGTPIDGSLAALKGSETLKVGKDKKDCYVLTTQTPGLLERRTLWIDKSEFIIWKSVDRRKSFDTGRDRGFDTYDPGVTLQTTVTITTKQLTLNPPFDKKDFVFTPPDHAKRVDVLKLSGNPF